MRRFLILLLVVGALTILLGKPVLAISVESITMPQADIFLGFVSGGLVEKVLVKEGDYVKKGSLLARLNDSVEMLELERMSDLAEDTTRLMAAEAELAQKRADLKKLHLASEKGAATDMEIEHATLAVTTAELQVRMEQFQKLQHEKNRDILKAKIERMRIVSSVSGNVEEIKIENGESVEALAPVIRVVKINPLWIDVPVPLRAARKLKVGSMVTVTFPDDQQYPKKGEVIYVSSVADAASDTLRIRVEVSNKKKRMAGERVSINISDD